MPLLFVGRASKAAAHSVSVPATQPFISFDPFDTSVGTKQVTIRAGGPGVTHIGWEVFRNQAPNYTWYGPGHDNIPLVGGAATVTVTLNAIGDRIKAYKTAASGGASSRDFSLTKDSDFATAAPGGGGGGGGGGGVPGPGPSAIWSRMNLGWNNERTSIFAHSGATSPSYYQYYRDRGITHVRFFATYPQPWGIDGSRGSIQRWIDAVGACIQSGMEVTHLDAADVCGYENLGNALSDYVQMFAEAVAQDLNPPADRFIMGSANEWAGGNNAAYQGQRFTCNNRIRAALPNICVVENPCNWGDPNALVYPDKPGFDGTYGTFVPWSDTNSIVQVHHYIGLDINYLVNLFSDVWNWSVANGRKVFSGEYGMDDIGRGNIGNLGSWVNNMNQEVQQLAVARMKPTIWATTEVSGNDWSTNEDGSNQFKPAFANAVPGWAQKITDLNNGTQTPDPPPPPPPPPTGGAKINVLLRGQSNALLFADTGGFARFRDLLQQQLNRPVGIYYAWNDNDPATIWSGTPFVTNHGYPGWKDAGRQERLRQFHVNLASDEKAAPFIELWMHNEDDQKGWWDPDGVSTTRWVDAVREDAGIMRGAIGRSAAEMPYFFLKVRYNSGDFSNVLAGMNQLAADGSFNARVSDAAWGANMDWDGTPNGAHLSSNDALNIIAPALAAEFAAWLG